jgi:uncharacterized iron-regulated membrane protein
LWEYLSAIPEDIASGLIGTTIILSAVSGFLVWIKGIPVSEKLYVTPMVLMGIAWISRWLSEIFGESWLLALFSIVSFIAAGWALVNVCIVLFGRRN